MKNTYVTLCLTCFVFLGVISKACEVNEDHCYEITSKKNNKKWTCRCFEEDYEYGSTRLNEDPKPDDDYNKNKDCEPYNPPVPDFSAPNRRLSVTKCYEYIWMIKKKQEEEKRAARCRILKVPIKWKRQVETEEKPTDVPTTENTNLSIGNDTKERLQQTDIRVVLGELKAVPQILGGHDASPAEFPHMGAIGWKSTKVGEEWTFKCGSTLVSTKWVITAAHCSQTTTRDTTVADVVPKIVRFGVEDIVHYSFSRPFHDKNIIKIIKHDQYAPPKKYFDIALFELHEEVTLTKFVHPACLWTGDVQKIKEAEVTGWGVTNKNAHGGAPFLQAATLNLVDDLTCDNMLKPRCSRHYCGLQSHQFCAGQMAGGIDACQGDSGGPIQSKIPLPSTADANMHYLIGVTSFGIGCGELGMPGVYTKIPYFLDWIEGIVF